VAESRRRAGAGGVWRYLGTQEQPAAAAAISRESACRRSNDHHLSTPWSGGIVVQSPRNGYALGVPCYELALARARQTSTPRLARAPLAALVEQHRQETALAIMHGREVILRLEERATGALHDSRTSACGSAAHLTASGRAMRAQCPGTVSALTRERAVSCCATTGGRGAIARAQAVSGTRGRGFGPRTGESVRQSSPR